MPEKAVCYYCCTLKAVQRRPEGCDQNDVPGMRSVKNPVPVQMNNDGARTILLRDGDVRGTVVCLTMLCASLSPAGFQCQHVPELFDSRTQAPNPVFYRRLEESS
jgi:hypothetical protein